MEIEVTLCGHTSYWNFAGTDKFNNWASQVPWQRDGGLCVIKTGGQGQIEGLYRSLDRVLHGLNGSHRILDIQRVNCGGSFSSPFQSFLHNLELDPSLGEIEARDLIRTRLLDKPTVFLFSEEKPVLPSQWEALISLVEHYRKASIPICAIIIDDRGIVHSEPICDFTIGRCTHQVFRPSIGLDVETVWSAYVHQRIYWECAGDLGLAVSLAKTVADIETENDEKLESCFQDYATLLAAHQSYPLLRDVVLAADTGKSYKSSDIHALVGSRLMWHPPGLPAPRVVPWAARALLREQKLSGREVGNLRHMLICSPLAAEVMAICLQSEQYVRSRLYNRGKVEELGQNTFDIHERFVNGNDPINYYPTAHPAPPSKANDIWVFASLGELLYCCPKSAVSDLDRNTLALRNGVAHGHYVAWHQVKVALKQLSHGVSIY